MAKGLEYYAWDEKRQLNKILKESNISPNTPNTAIISAMEARLQQYPLEWLSWYFLAGLYGSNGNLLEALRTSEKCYQIKPEDNRSIYTLASSLRSILNAKYLDNINQMHKPFSPEWSLEVDKLMRRIAQGVNPAYRNQLPDIKACYSAFLQLHTPMDQLGERAIRLYELLVERVKSSQEQRVVKETLSALYDDFPQIARKYNFAWNPQNLIAGQ